MFTKLKKLLKYLFTKLISRNTKNKSETPHEIKPEHNIYYIEVRKEAEIADDLVDHINYLDQVYDLCFKIQHSLNGKTRGEIGNQLGAQMMILMRITDFLRCIRHVAKIGYPEQAGTLTSSIFELAQTGLYFVHSEKAAKNWLECDDIKMKMPKLIGLGTYEDLVKINYTKAGFASTYDYEYKVYKQLCWMKHSHPVMQDLLLKDMKLQFQVGPYSDEKCINNAWFSIQHAGRLTELLIANLVKLNELVLVSSQLIELARIRDVLDKKAMTRFDRNDPFKK